MKRFLVFGRKGQLASALNIQAARAKTALHFVGSDSFDLLTRTREIGAFIAEQRNIDGVINTSAYTNVDKAEMDDPEQAWVLNALAPQFMAAACRTQKIPFFHISTDCVFNGQKSEAYTPEDPSHPVNFYGATKREGEKNILAVGGQSFIFRTAWVFSQTGQNFVTAMLNIGAKNNVIHVVNDQIGLPIYAPHLAKALLHAANVICANPVTPTAPIHHIVGSGPVINRYDFAKIILKTAGLKTMVKPISSVKFAATAPRPQNATLDTRSFTTTFDYTLPDWRDGLNEMLIK